MAVPTYLGVMMTIPRVLLTAALLVLGFMIWGLHNDAAGLRGELVGLRGDFKGGIETFGSKLVAAATPVPSIAPKPCKTIRVYRNRPAVVGKPKVPPVKHILPAPAPVQPFNPFSFLVPGNS
jgi:hypothetical protein